MLGTTIHERYCLEAELGRGGMGVIYRAHDLLLEREVAVKLLSQSELGTQGRARLLHEAQSTAKLNHPNIVSVYDAGEVEGAPFIVMEYVEGRSLHDLCPADIDVILALAVQVCAALEHAHNLGIVHRDLKPENILVTADGKAKLMDFGLARSVASRLTSEGTLIGTAFYLAPEQALGQEIDGRADLYALGVMLYELTSGRLPFAAEDPIAVISQHLYAPVVPPRAYNEQIPPELESLILQLLSKSAEERPATAAEVARRLEQVRSAGRPGGAPPALLAKALSPLERIVRGQFVGRQREFAEASAELRRAMGGEGHVLLVSGEPGIGKTRLVRELLTQAQVMGVQAFAGDCYAEGGAPYASLAQILREALPNLAKQGLPPAILANLLTLAPDLRWRYPDVPPNPPLNDPQLEQQRLFECFITFCIALAERAPVLFVLEDVHWADSASLSLVRHLARRGRKLRLLLVMTYREVELDEDLALNNLLQELNRDRLAVRLKLGRLDRDQTRDLLAALFVEEITPELLDGIYRETEGNPFFIEEVCKALIEDGKLYFEGGRWHRPSMDEIEIPQSLRLAIQSRLGKLTPQAQDLLRMAAVLGREFDYGLLLKASELDEDAQIEGLEAAERAQLITEIRHDGRLAFAFAHALILATLREGISGMRRQRLHRRAALALEAVHPDSFEALAQHYASAGDYLQARVYFDKAGERALGVFANVEAERHFRSALELGGSDAERARWMVGLGEALDRQSCFNDAAKVWIEAVNHFKSMDDYEAMAKLYAKLARNAWDAGDTPRGLALARQGLQVLSGKPGSRATAALLHEAGRACAFNGLLQEAQPLCQQALEMAQRLGDVEVQAEALSTLGLIFFDERRFDEAFQAQSQAVQLAEASKLLRTASRALNNLAVFSWGTGEMRWARQSFLRAAEVARQAGTASIELFYHCNATGTSIEMGEIAEAERMLPVLHQLAAQAATPGMSMALLRWVELFLMFARGQEKEALQGLESLCSELRQQGNLQHLSGINSILAYQFIALGRWQDAVAPLAEAIEVNDRMTIGDVQNRCILSGVCSHLGQPERGRQLLDEARQKTGGRPNSFELNFLGWAEALLARAEGRWEGAFLAFRQASERLEKIEYRVFHTLLLQVWAEAHLARGAPGDREKAQELLRQSLVEYEAMPMPAQVARLQERLYSLEQ